MLFTNFVCWLSQELSLVKLALGLKLMKISRSDLCLTVAELEQTVWKLLLLKQVSNSALAPRLCSF